MSEDWLEGIKHRLQVTALAGKYTDALTVDDKYRLISELTECREENKIYDSLFSLQQPRLKKAQHLWQEATGKHDTLPDLGVLLEWLMDLSSMKSVLIKSQGKANIKQIQEINHLAEAIGGVGEAFEKQRRHRKWALKKAKNNLDIIYLLGLRMEDKDE